MIQDGTCLADVFTFIALSLHVAWWPRESLRKETQREPEAEFEISAIAASWETRGSVCGGGIHISR